MARQKRGEERTGRWWAVRNSQTGRREGRAQMAVRQGRIEQIRREGGQSDRDEQLLRLGRALKRDIKCFDPDELMCISYSSLDFGSLYIKL